jgi:hypothetical protein
MRQSVPSSRAIGIASRSFASNWRRLSTSAAKWGSSSIARSPAPVGSTAYVRTREAHVVESVEGMVVRLTVYSDIDEGRAAAERLAASRG